MTLALIETEIQRFLSKVDAEALCISGKWGVGKTYAWKKFLQESRQQRKLAIEKYSYVSLFGVNSLDDLKYAIFENTTQGDDLLSPPSLLSLNNLLNKSTGKKKLKTLLELIAATFNRKGLTDLASRSTFLAVRDQLICFDDIERLGDNLKIKDILGLASQLKEERNCKIVLLMNSRELDTEKQKELHRQLEKVIDSYIEFKLTSSEASEIALDGTKLKSNTLHERAIQLNITNIRVIKKIERLAIQLEEILKGFHAPVIDQAMSTLALAGWAHYIPGESPPLDFIRDYNSISMRMDEKIKEDSKMAEWSALLDNYPYTSSDELDRQIIEDIKSGYFNEVEIQSKAYKTQETIQKHYRSSYSATWQDMYHGSLSVDDNDFLETLFETAKENISTISSININSGIMMLREYSRNEQANKLIDLYMNANKDQPLSFFDLKNHMFFTKDDPVDPGLIAAFENARLSFVDKRSPMDALKEIGEKNGYNEQDLLILSKQKTESLVELLESLSKPYLTNSIENLIRMCNQNKTTHPDLRENTVSALKIIGSKSPIRQRKIRKYLSLADADFNE